MVSIQLVSPASGEGDHSGDDDIPATEVSIQLVSPASGERKSMRHKFNYRVSIQLVSPASGEHQGIT